MKLNINSIEKIRKEIEELILEVPDGMRITLDNDLLDSLIFFRLKSNNGAPDIKIPVWTGEFLRKLDLSKLSFDNAWFYTGKVYDESRYACYKTDRREYKNIRALVKTQVENFNIYFAPFVRPGIIDFSNTNIKINFSKLYETVIYDTKFDNVDLSRSKGEMLSVISGSSFRNTGVRLDFDSIMIKNSDFSDNDFSSDTISLNTFYDVNLVDIFASAPKTHSINLPFICSHLDNCNFSNTGLNIEFENIDNFFKELEKEYYKKYILDPNKYPYTSNDRGMTRSDVEKRNREIRENFSEQYSSLNNRFVIECRKGNFNGCYFCGQKVMSSEEKEANKERLLVEYRAFEDKELKKVRDCFKKQISKK